MLDQIASGERIQPYNRDPSERHAPRPPKVQRWRSLQILRPDLAAQLHPTRNASLDPYAVGQHSHRKLWWRCAECGHEWSVSPHERTSLGRGCPECGKRRRVGATIARNKLPVAADRSLAVLHPQLLVEWHPTRNGDLDPRTVAPGSERKVWWRCATCGHEWGAIVNDRASKRAGRPPTGCPVCALSRRAKLLATAPRERSLGAVHPALLAEWHPTRNGDLDPFTVNPGSERKVWWRCATCGHEWSAAVNVRSRAPRGGCRHCAHRRGQRERRARERQAVVSAPGR